MGFDESLKRVASFKLVLRPRLLLLPQTPKPLHEVTPRTILGVAWWNRTRQEAYASTGYHCAACGVSKHCAMFHRWLEGHETYRVNYRKGRMVYTGTVPLCHACHSFIHRGRLEALLEKVEIPQARYDAIINHGKRVLKAAKLKPKPVYNGVCAPWGEWRLVIFSKEYPPKYKTEEEWLKVFG